MKELDIIELKIINGGGQAGEVSAYGFGYAFGRAAGIITAFLIGSKFKLFIKQ